MNLKQLIGIFIIFIGCGFFGFSSYITNQVNEGKIQVSDAQKKVNTGKKVLGLSPYTKPVGQELAKSAQKKINAGKEDIAHYESVAAGLQIGGWIAVGVGVILTIALFNWRGSKKRRP